MSHLKFKNLDESSQIQESMSFLEFKNCHNWKKGVYVTLKVFAYYTGREWQYTQTLTHARKTKQRTTFKHVQSMSFNISNIFMI